MASRLWEDMSTETWGISILEDSKYGYDHPTEDTLRMTLLYTPKTRPLNGFRDQKYHDWGEHTIHYGIFGHVGSFKQTDLRARRFNQPIRSFNIKKDHPNPVQENISLFEVSDSQIGILAVKKPEASEGMIIRLYERYGVPVEGKIHFPSENLRLREVIEMNGLEEQVGKIEQNEKSFKVQLEANGIRTYHVQFQPRSTPDTSCESIEIIQEPVTLDYNVKMISSQGEQLGIFPRELIPSKISAGPIDFHISNSDMYNALQCKSQNVLLPKRYTYTTLSILLASVEDTKFPLTWFDSANRVIKEVYLPVASMTGYVGQWDTRIWKKKPTHTENNKRDYVWMNTCIGVHPGYINRHRLEWYSTHIHEHGEDRPYRYGYLYTIEIQIPENTESLLLPDNPLITIFAITVSNQMVDVESTHHLQDKYDF
ncbi:MAG: hypothetical protein E4G98_01700 [Promethearchaeota archaeon]|nr:MAG: hypothetical protein E4G98_01700 [Candidatus Lokiarchaeota archaeon]